MADNTQAAVTLLAHQLHTHDVLDVSQVGTEQDVRSWFNGTIYIYHANIQVTANSIGVDYVLQGRYDTGATINENWVDIVPIRTGTTAADTQAISGTEAAGETTIAVGADPSVDFVPRDEIYILDTGTLADSEWAQVDHAATAPDIITLVDGLTNAKDSADSIFTQAERRTYDVELSGYSYVRMVMYHTAPTGSDIHFKAEMVAVTDIE